AEIRQVRIGVADEEVVDVVLAGVDAGGEGRPRGRRLRRVRRLQGREPALLRQRADVRQLAFGHPLLEQVRVHAVETEDDQLLAELRWPATAAGRRGCQPRCRGCSTSMRASWPRARPPPRTKCISEGA